MISFLQHIPKYRIDVSSLPELQTFQRRIERYALEVYFLDVSLETDITSITCLLLDRTGSGPAVTTGLGASIDPIHAIKTAAFEAVRRHISARDRFYRTDALPLPAKYSFDWFLLKKQQLWCAPHMIDKALEFIHTATKTKKIKIPHSQPDKVLVDKLVADLASIGAEVLYVDMTTPQVREQGFVVVKVLIPELVPLWRDERYPYLGIPRLYDVPSKMGLTPIREFVLEDALSIHPF